MSQGNFITSVYETNSADLFSVSIQPETLTLTLNTVANTAPTGTPPTGMPSAKVSGGRAAIGVNCRKVRFKFTGSLPPGYSANRILTVPVLQQSVFNGYGRGQTGTYTLEGTAYDVAFVGKSGETIN